MAIINRIGDIVDFDPNKMLSGEWAFPSDGYAYYCVAPGTVKKVVTAEEIQTILNASAEAYVALQALLAELEGDPSGLTNILNDIITLQSGKLDKTGDASNTILASITTATVDADITVNDSLKVIVGKIIKRFVTLATAIESKINITNIVQNATTSDATKVPSTVVTRSLQDQVTTINNNLSLSATGHKVGTIDGVDLYQKTVQITVTTTGWTFAQTIFTASPSSAWIDVGDSYMSNGTYKFPINYVESGYQNWARVSLNTSVDLYIGASFPAASYLFNLSIKYT